MSGNATRTPTYALGALKPRPTERDRCPSCPGPGWAGGYSNHLRLKVPDGLLGPAPDGSRYNTFPGCFTGTPLKRSRSQSHTNAWMSASHTELRGLAVGPLLWC